MKKNLYNYDRTYERCQLNLAANKHISARNREIITQYDRDCKLKGSIEIPTLIKYYDVLSTVATKYTKKDFDLLTKNDFEKVIEQINAREDITVSTKQKYWTILKKFGAWLAFGDKIFNGNAHREYPETVSWINTTIKNKNLPKVKASDILTEDEVDRLIKAGANTRDKAFLSILYESGSRISELGNIKIQQITEVEHGYLVDLASGKTGERNIIVVFSSAKLSQWLNEHPRRNDKNAYVWCGLLEDGSSKRIDKLNKIKIDKSKQKLIKRKIGEPLGYRGLAEIIVRAKIKANITKRTHAHLFRHSRITHLFMNRQINEQQAKVYFGWSPSSRQLATYSHVTASDVNNTMLAINGIKQQDVIVNGKKAKVCKNCNKPNDPKDNYCGFCSKPLDFRTLMQEQDFQNRTTKNIISDPHMKDLVKRQLIDQIKKEIFEQAKKEVLEELAKDGSKKNRKD